MRVRQGRQGDAVVVDAAALEAMIAHSDNTATDIVLKHVGPENVDAFIAEIGLTQTVIPLSTHQFFGYAFGVEDWEGTTWDQLRNPDPSLSPRPILNDTITMASTINTARNLRTDTPRASREGPGS